MPESTEKSQADGGDGLTPVPFLGTESAAVTVPCLPAGRSPNYLNCGALAPHGTETICDVGLRDGLVMGQGRGWDGEIKE